jgi:hypothetical protein
MEPDLDNKHMQLKCIFAILGWMHFKSRKNKKLLMVGMKISAIIMESSMETP